ncbi:MAG: hypothetical protein Q7U91_08975 [Sideroxyarcus sp.]|nr:hypothetical protein [Sideroxyarcus sp.]
MTTISSSPTPAEVSAALAQSAATQLAVINTLASLGGNSSAPSDYSFADLLSSFQQTAPSATNTATTGAQAAQNALLGVEYAISLTLSSLISGTTPDASETDIFTLINPAGTTGTNGLFGAQPGSFMGGFTGSTSAEAAHYAMLNAQYAVNQTLGSLMASNTSSRT